MKDGFIFCCVCWMIISWISKEPCDVSIIAHLLALDTSMRRLRDLFVERSWPCSVIQSVYLKCGGTKSVNLYDQGISPWVTASIMTAAMAKDEENREQNQRSSSKNTQHHQQQHIVIRPGWGHWHFLHTHTQIMWWILKLQFRGHEKDTNTMRHNEDKRPSATSTYIVSPVVLDTKEQKIIQCQSISVFIQLSSCDGTGLCVDTHSRCGAC